MPDSTQRFSDRVDNYIRWRPGYPRDVLDILAEEIGLRQSSVLADIGSGTGISARLFLDAGHTVFGVEPNREMREAAERLLSEYPRFISVNGTAEQTTLNDGSVSYVIAAQAFHWFNVEATRAEFRRILTPDGWCILLWNSRRLDSTPFLREYESLLNQYGTDYQQVQHTNIDPQKIAAFLAPGSYRYRSVYNEQRFDLEGVRGRLLSSSYVPAEGHPHYAPLLEQLEKVFHAHQDQGQVCFEYDTEIHMGRMV